MKTAFPFCVLLYAFVVVAAGAQRPDGFSGHSISLENQEKRKCPCAERLKEPQMSMQVEHIEMEADLIGDHVNIKGIALMEITVDNDGRVLCLHALSGHPLAVTHLIEAARRWKFKPYLKNGNAQRFFGHLRLHFSFVENKPSVEVVAN